MRGKRTKQLAYIDKYTFPSALFSKVSKHYPHLSQNDINTVFQALRDYFHICNLANKRMVSMPSQVVDVAWHEFILFTKNYEHFCNKSLGRFLHHTPSETMQSPTVAQTGIKRAWSLACKKAGISPNAPQYLPLLFAIDSQLNIDDGFHYSLNCQDKSSPHYGSGFCAGHIGCTSGCPSGGVADDTVNLEFTSDSLFGGGDSGDSGGCGSGCGGD